jgi:hypothetical protein
VKPVFKLRHRDVRRVPVVKLGERQGKFRAELFQRHLGFAGLREDKIRGFQNGGQIVHQSPGPVEDDVADHAWKLTAKARRHQEKQKLCVLVSWWLTIVVLIAFNKPFGVLSQFTGDSSPNRALAEFQFPKNVYPIGRLDADSEGLLLLSDEPVWNERLLHPRHAHEREYWAQVERIPKPENLKPAWARHFDSRPENPAVPRVAVGAAAGNSATRLANPFPQKRSGLLDWFGID